MDPSVIGDHGLKRFIEYPQVAPRSVHPSLRSIPRPGVKMLNIAPRRHESDGVHPCIELELGDSVLPNVW